MKTKVYYAIWAVVSLFFTACDYDNYDEPKSNLTGRIVYQGEPIGVSYNDVYFQLWEPGWQTKAPINVNVDQDGTYSAVLFDANYKLVFPGGQGPFMPVKNTSTNSDTIAVDLKGSKTLDIEVMPFYMVRNAQFTAAGRKVTGTFKLDKIITDANARNVERVSLYVGRTQFVDGRSGLPVKDVNAADIPDMNNISLSVDVPAITPAQNYVYARVGVKIAGVEDMLFSPVQKVTLQ